MVARERVMLALLETGAGTITSISLFSGEAKSAVRNALSKLVKGGLVEKNTARIRRKYARYSIPYYTITRDGMEWAMLNPNIVNEAPWVEDIECYPQTAIVFKNSKTFTPVAESVARYIQSVIARSCCVANGVVAEPMAQSWEYEEEEEASPMLNMGMAVKLAYEKNCYTEMAAHNKMPLFVDGLSIKRREIILLKKAGEVNEEVNGTIADIRRSQIRGFLETTEDAYAIYTEAVYGMGWTYVTTQLDQSIMYRYRIHWSQYNKATRSVSEGMNYAAILMTKNAKEFVNNFRDVKGMRRTFTPKEKWKNRIGSGTYLMYVVPYDEEYEYDKEKRIYYEGCTDPFRFIVGNSDTGESGKTYLARMRKLCYDLGIQNGYLANENPNSNERSLFPLTDANQTPVHISPLIVMQDLYAIDDYLEKDPSLPVTIWATGWQIDYWERLFPKKTYPNVRIELIDFGKMEELVSGE